MEKKTERNEKRWNWRCKERKDKKRTNRWRK
jgi:hypothetical protein